MTANNTKHNCSKSYMLAMKIIVITFTFSMLAMILKYENLLDADAAIWSFYSEQTLQKILNIIYAPFMIIVLLIFQYERDSRKKYKGIKLSEFLIATSLAICLISMVVGLDQALNPEPKITMEQFLKGEGTSTQQQPTEDSHDKT